MCRTDECIARLSFSTPTFKHQPIHQCIFGIWMISSFIMDMCSLLLFSSDFVCGVKNLYQEKTLCGIPFQPWSCSLFMSRCIEVLMEGSQGINSLILYMEQYSQDWSNLNFNWFKPVYSDWSVCLKHYYSVLAFKLIIIRILGPMQI